MAETIHYPQKFVDWLSIDWSKDDDTLQKETGRSLKYIRQNRLKLANATEEERAAITEAKKAARRTSKDTKYARVCHDCGKPTNDYRCPTCLHKWRVKHGVTSGYVDDDMVALAV